ncbi:hypothetical protein [Plasmodium yoelii yoelii]|uniref:Uncharacterized protein n=1 Tax=Plasmodium yoelii yoelii TaxID=73239 RepID=Q7RD64_PLAYO|nr:hypothetical protein [Plasmodium yoelii yoelii]
MFLYVEPILG